MPEVTLDAIDHLLDFKLDEKLDAKLAPIHNTLNQHTTALAALTTDVKTLLNEKTVSAERFDRLEHWAERAGKTLNINLDL